jgi:hypothetical protein
LSNPFAECFSGRYIWYGVGVAMGAIKLMLLDIPKLPRRQLAQAPK